MNNTLIENRAKTVGDLRDIINGLNDDVQIILSIFKGYDVHNNIICDDKSDIDIVHAPDINTLILHV